MSSQNSKWHSLGDFLAAKEAKKESEAAAPVPEAAPTSSIAPLPGTAPTPNTSEPLVTTAPVLYTPPTRRTPPVPEKGGHTRITHQVSDDILPTLDVFAQSILQRLLRLSWGWHSDTCKVGMVRLANTCNVSESKARRAVQLLVARNLIAVVEHDFANHNQSERGTTYRILLASASRTASTGNTAPVRQIAPISNTPNKENTQKENTQTQEPSAIGMRVGSKFTIEECRRYAKHLQATGQGINNPGGYATTIKRTGEADELIAAFLDPTAPSKPLDVSQCPDCHGAGMYYPEGLGKGGVKKCNHVRLKEEPKI